MHEAVLRDFFHGAADVAVLRADLTGTVTRTGHDVFQHRVVDMDDDFTVDAAHLIALCDATLAGQLSPADLSTIATCMELSDRFQWDSGTPEGELVADMLNCWSSPEINYPLTPATLAKFRLRLTTGEDTFTVSDVASQHIRSTKA